MPVSDMDKNKKFLYEVGTNTRTYYFSRNMYCRANRLPSRNRLPISQGVQAKTVEVIEV